MELNRQNFKYYLPSNSENQQTIERAAHPVSGPFHLGTTGGGGGLGPGGFTETELRGKDAGIPAHAQGCALAHGQYFGLNSN